MNVFKSIAFWVLRKEINQMAQSMREALKLLQEVKPELEEWRKVKERRERRKKTAEKNKQAVEDVPVEETSDEG